MKKLFALLALVIAATSFTAPAMAADKKADKGHEEGHDDHKDDKAGH